MSRYAGIDVTIVLTYVLTTPSPATYRVFSDRQPGRHTEQDSWIELQVAPGEYAEIGQLLSLDKAGFVKDKIQYVRLTAVGAAANHKLGRLSCWELCGQGRIFVTVLD